jgi:CHAD domain-containing protein
VARACSGLRDLDVMRLDLAARADDVPSALRAGVARLQSEVEHDRAAELRAFNAVLAGDDWRRLKRDWRAALRALASGAPMGVDAEEPAGPLLGRALRRRYERVGELAREAETGDGAALHRLRIGCKKLRYTIEFVAVMDREADELLVSLTGIQDVLGELNDLRVQEARLQAALAVLPGPGPEAATRAAAIGALLTILERRRRRLARRCGDRLDDLSRRGFTRALGRVAAGG